ncbi:MAG TPA: DUF4249 domain-containing protein [Chryseolinea sp.]|nr:DUF4249 domain-containing protein [Chryseolinea sp.]
MTFRSSLWVFVVLLFGCLEPTDIVTARLGDELVISGQISTLEEQSSLTIGATAETKRLPYPVSGASVIIYEDGDSLGRYIESIERAGKYILEGHKGVPGKIYEIKVTLPDDRTYWSAPEKMPEEAGTVSSYYEHVREEVIDGEGTLTTLNFLKVYANASLPSAEMRYFRWVAEEVFIIVPYTPPLQPFTSPSCYITQLADPQFLVLLDRQNLNASEIPDKLVAQRLVDDSFLYQHYFVTYQSALTAEAYDYWRKVDILISANGSLFDPPPAKIYGNIIGEQGIKKIFGYFQATNQTLHRISIKRTDFPYLLNASDCQTGLQAIRCSNCILLQNSSYVQPAWF